MPATLINENRVHNSVRKTKGITYVYSKLVRGSNPVGGEIFHTCPDGANPASCTMGTGYFPGVKSGRGVTLTPHPLLVPWSRKSRAIPLLPLWVVRPVQSFSACTRVHFIFTLLETYYQIMQTYC